MDSTCISSGLNSTDLGLCSNSSPDVANQAVIPPLLCKDDVKIAGSCFSGTEISYFTKSPTAKSVNLATFVTCGGNTTKWFLSLSVGLD